MFVLFAYDGSPFSKRALRYAKRFGPDTRVAVIAVAPVLIEAPHTEQSTPPEASSPKTELRTPRLKIGTSSHRLLQCNKTMPNRCLARRFLRAYCGTASNNVAPVSERGSVTRSAHPANMRSNPLPPHNPFDVLRDTVPRSGE